MSQQRFAPVNYYLYHDISHRHVKIHLANCGSYTGREGEITYRKDDGRVSGEWHGPYLGLKEARARAAAMESRVMECMLKTCMGA